MKVLAQDASCQAADQNVGIQSLQCRKRGNSVTNSRTFLDHEPDDQSLIDLALGGDSKAFERLLRR